MGSNPTPAVASTSGLIDRTFAGCAKDAEGFLKGERFNASDCVSLASAADDRTSPLEGLVDLLGSRPQLGTAGPPGAQCRTRTGRARR